MSDRADDDDGAGAGGGGGADAQAVDRGENADPNDPDAPTPERLRAEIRDDRRAERYLIRAGLIAALVVAIALWYRARYG